MKIKINFSSNTIVSLFYKNRVKILLVLVSTISIVLLQANPAAAARYSPGGLMIIGKMLIKIPSLIFPFLISWWITTIVTKNSEDSFYTVGLGFLMLLIFQSCSA